MCSAPMILLTDAYDPDYQMNHSTMNNPQATLVPSHSKLEGPQRNVGAHHHNLRGHLEAWESIACSSRGHTELKGPHQGV